MKAVNPSDMTDVERMERVKLVDSITLSPSQRALRVHKFIDALKFPELVTQWDMICYCAWYLGYTFQKDESTVYESLRRIMFAVNQFHYFYCEDHEAEEKMKLEHFIKKVSTNSEDNDKIWTINDFKHLSKDIK